jgi:alcohol dehydrogenase (NADP+)
LCVVVLLAVAESLPLLAGNEAEVGAGLTDVIARGVVAREDLFITSKLWAQECHADRVAAALTKTLADLQTPYLDLYLIHWPFFIAKESAVFPPLEESRLGYSPAAYLAVWRELEKEVDAGRVRHLGGSNMTAPKLTALLAEARIRPAANQIELHPSLQQQAFVDWLLRQGIAVTAYSPLGSPDRPARLVSEGDPAPLTHPAVVAIAAARGVSPGQVLLRWAVQRGTAAIPKSVTPSRIAQNLDIFGFELSDADMAAIAALDTNHRLVKGMQNVRAGQTWHDIWDEGFVFPAAE